MRKSDDCVSELILNPFIVLILEDFNWYEWLTLKSNSWGWRGGRIAVRQEGDGFDS